MAKIANPNDIVEELVDDYRRIFGEDLISAVMYGSAVTHEYKPGFSEINTILVLTDDSIACIKKCIPAAKKWQRLKVAVPFFMTEQFIAAAVNSYPIEFLDIQTNHRVLYGEDLLSHLDITRQNLRLQCERELWGVSIHLRKNFIESKAMKAILQRLATESMKKLLPVFKALLRINNKPLPKISDDVIMAVEDLFNLGASALSEIHSSIRHPIKPAYDESLFNRYVNTIDDLVRRIDAQTVAQTAPFQQKFFFQSDTTASKTPEVKS